eukprot:PhF_6_TR3394/c0_g1_i1/m.4855
MQIDVLKCMQSPAPKFLNTAPSKQDSQALCKRVKSLGPQPIQDRFVEYFLRCYATGTNITPSALRNLQCFLFTQPPEVCNAYQDVAIRLYFKEHGQTTTGKPPNLSPRSDALVTSASSAPFLAQLRRSLLRQKKPDTKADAVWVTSTACHHRVVYDPLDTKERFIRASTTFTNHTKECGPNGITVEAVQGPSLGSTTGFDFHVLVPSGSTLKKKGATVNVDMSLILPPGVEVDKDFGLDYTVIVEFGGSLRYILTLHVVVGSSRFNTTQQDVPYIGTIYPPAQLVHCPFDDMIEALHSMPETIPPITDPGCLTSPFELFLSSCTPGQAHLLWWVVDRIVQRSKEGHSVRMLCVTVAGAMMRAPPTVSLTETIQHAGCLCSFLFYVVTVCKVGGN